MYCIGCVKIHFCLRRRQDKGKRSVLMIISVFNMKKDEIQFQYRFPFRGERSSMSLGLKGWVKILMVNLVFSV